MLHRQTTSNVESHHQVTYYLKQNAFQVKFQGLKDSITFITSTKCSIQVSIYFKAQTTCQVGVGSAGQFWQRLGWLGSSKEQRSANLPPTSKLYLFMGMGPKNIPMGQTFILATCTTPPQNQGWWSSACKKLLVKMFMVSQYISNQLSQRSKRSGWCRQVGSDKERSKGCVGSGSGNARGRPGPNILSLALYFFPYSTHKLPSFKTKLHCMQHKAELCLTKHITVFYVPINI